MSDYPWERLSSRSFEHVVQALALRAFGIGVLVWGDGPDGGREATYEGPLRNPFTGKIESGYLVIQAKFLQRPPAQAGDQSESATRQLKEELDKYRAPGKRRPPDGYIFATNAY